MAADLSPGFGGATVAAQSFVQNSPVEAVTLPEASGGDGALTYALSPALPAGLSFDAATRTISGTPAEASETATYTWTATDADAADPDSASLIFTLAVAADLSPGFGGATVAAQSFVQNSPVEAVTLPEASGGDGALTYALSPALPAGLSFDAATRTISGTPAEASAATYTWTATDADAADPDSASLIFTLAVAADLSPGFGGATVAAQSFVQNSPVEAVTLPEASGGDGALTYALSPALPAGLSFDAATRTISGTPAEASETATYTWTATDADAADPDSASLIFTLAVAADLSPGFGGATVAAQSFVQNSPVEAVTLPEASGGDGALTYALSPALPAGLSFDAATRTISGTPAEASETATYTWTATDADAADPDSASIAFTIAVKADLAPAFAGAAIADRLSWKQNLPIEPLALPAAEGGDGELSYALSPALPDGLALDAATRTLSGTPRAVLDETRYAWTATDADGDSAELTFAVAVEADYAPSFGEARIGLLRLDQYVAMEPLVLPEAQGGDGELAYELRGALPAGLAFNAAARALSGTPMELSESRRYEYVVTDADPRAPDAAILAFSIEVGVAAADREVLDDALAAQGGALLSSAAEVIGTRLRNRDAGAAGHDAAAAGPLGGAGAAGFGGAAGPGASGGGPPAQVAGGMPPFAFALPPGGGHANRWTLWGAGATRSFSGSSPAGPYDGSMRSLYVGADGRLADNWVAGAALAHSRGGANYDAQAQGGAAGQLRTRLNGLYPYLQGRFDSGLELWALGGWGSGEAHNERSLEGAAVETAGLRMRMAAAGARHSISWRGPFELAVVGGAGTLNLATGSGERAVDGLAADATQARLALELAGSGPASPYVQLGARRDNAGSRRDTGLEVAGGFRYSGRRFEIDGSGRWLSAGGSGNYEEYGGALRLAFRPKDDGTGLRFSVAPSWGAADGALLVGGEGLLGGPAFGALPMAGGAGLPGSPALSLDGELGYGFASTRLNGLVTPVVAYRDGGFGNCSLELGVAYQSLPSPLAGNLAMRLTVGRAHAGGPAGSDYGAQFALAYRPAGGRRASADETRRPPDETPAASLVERPAPRPAPSPAMSPAPSAEAPLRAGSATPREAAPEGAAGEAAMPANSRPAPKIAASLNPAPAVSALRRDCHAWLLGQPPTRYAVQLAAYTRPGNLEAFVAANGLHDLPQARVERGGQAFHVLLLGVYATREAAQQAAAARPPELSVLTPWVRSLRSLQQALSPASGTGASAIGCPAQASY